MTVLGQHKVLTFDKYDVESVAPRAAVEHRINLYQGGKKESDRSLIAENISLQTLYDEHIKDGQLLYMTKHLDKKTIAGFHSPTKPGVTGEYRDMALMKSHSYSVPIKRAQKMNKGKTLGPLKVVIFTLVSPPEYIRLCMDRAYQFIESGSPVEMRTRMQGQKLSKEERIRAGNPEVWPRLHSHFPHLRPDFILKSMPEGTKYFVEPVSDGRIVQWVMGVPAKAQPQANFTKRLFTVKRSVQKSIEEGQQAMLPKIMREQLQETGNLNYSKNTGLPKLQARLKYAAGGKVTYGGEERKWLARDAETDGFMVPNPEEAVEEPLVKYEAVKAPGGAPWKAQRGKVRKK